MPIAARTVPVLLAAGVLVGGANLAAYAATGSFLVLGHQSATTKTTTLKNTQGTALSLKSKKGTPSLKVSSARKVTKLNADKLDGLDSTALQTRPYVITLSGSVTASTINFPITGVPAGDYQVTYNVSAAVGGTPTFFGCFLQRPAVPLSAFLPQIGAASAGKYFVSAAGTYSVLGSGAEVLHCSSDGTSLLVPAQPGVTAQLVFTRIDGSSASLSTGTSPRTSGRAVLR